MMDRTQISGDFVRAYAQPDAIQSVLNVKRDLEMVPFAVTAKSIGSWPMFLNAPGPSAPAEGIPTNELTAGTVARGLAAAFEGR